MIITKLSKKRALQIFVTLGVSLALVGGAHAGIGYLQTKKFAASIGLSDIPLLTQSGEEFDPVSLLGRPTAVFFGFTHCPDICPMTLQRLAMMREKIGPSFDQLQVVFVTLDPNRDKHGVLNDYLSGQPVDVIGLTGSFAAVQRAATNFAVFHEQIEIPGQGYTIDHTASLFLIDRQGNRAGTIGIDASEGEFERKLRSVVAPASTGDLTTRQDES